METTLQGTDGSEEVTVDNLGKVVAMNEKSRKEPVKGDDVYLTIDSELQDACYKILEQRIAGVLVKNLTDAKKIDAKVLADNDTMAVASYDCYNAMIKNNIIDTSHFTAEDATAT
jgi:penicillin-binding protein 2